MSMLRASSLHRDSNCLATQMMAERAAQAGQLPPKSTKWSERGTRVHSGEVDSEDEQKAHSYIVYRSFEVFDSYAQGRDYKVEIEKPFYLRHDGLVPYFSGHPDRYIVLGNHCVFIDFKPGFECDWNAWKSQMDGYAALLYENLGVETLSGVIITRFHGIQTYEYDSITCREIIGRIERITEFISRPNVGDAPVNPGPWCRYCPARLICDAALVYPVQADKPGFRALPGGVGGSEVLDRLMILKKLVNEHIEWYQDKVAQSPNFLPGWEIGKGRNIPKIEDIDAAHDALCGKDGLLKSSDFKRTLNISVPRLREEIAAANKLSSDQAKQQLNAALGDLITYTQTKGSLVKSKPSEFALQP